MMTISQAPQDRSAWALRVALIGSLLLHLAIFVAGTLGYDVVTLVRNPSALTAPPAPSNEIVTITSPLIIEKRAPTVPPKTTSEPTRPAPIVRPPPGFGFPQRASDAAQRQTRMQVDFAKALEHNRQAALAALATIHDPAQVPEKYRLTMEGKHAKLTRGQGIYFPTRGWRENGLDYYDVSYEFVYPTGADEKGSVPWPIHFDPASDPFFSPDFAALRSTPMPGPPAGFTPPGDLGKALRAYFPSLHFEDADN